MKVLSSACLFIAAVACSGFAAGDESRAIVASGTPPGTLGLSLRNEVNASVQRGLDWLAANQKEDGSWSNPKFPALTALAARTFVSGKDDRCRQVIGRAVKYMLACAREDGGIYCEVPGQKGGGLSNYNTAICMTTFHAIGDPALTPYVLKARTFLAGTQHLGGDEYRGGFGYDASTQRAYADLLNTFYAVEAMNVTAGAEDLRPKGQAKADINWAETVKFIGRMQNTAEAGAADAGGFFYKPGESKAGATTNADGKVVFRSFGSITYAGMLALVYANVTRDDVRVRSAFKWASEHWSLDENPGMGQEGLYFFYNVLAKSLDAYGADMIPAQGKAVLDWRDAVARKLVSLQKIDAATGKGYWCNDNGRFWENDPVLVTAYAILTLQKL